MLCKPRSTKKKDCCELVIDIVSTTAAEWICMNFWYARITVLYLCTPLSSLSEPITDFRYLKSH